MPLKHSRYGRIWPFLTFALAVAIAALLAPRADIPASYHHFADQRSWLGIPNFGDVASNLAFLISGLWGLIFFFTKSSAQIFVDTRERWPYVFVFLGLLLTAFGSAYYHLAPDNARLVWDRLPMTIAFMALVAALIAERVDVELGIWLLPVLIAIGMASVIQWHMSVVGGAGDVRFYAAVQIYAVLALFVALLLRPRYTRGADILIVAGFYVLAKVCETFDHQIFALSRTVSGHTLKHLAAGAAGFWILQMLQKRKPLTSSAL
jgi:hypothetical protein